MNNLEKEALEYLKKKKEYNNVLTLLIEKYKKTGKLTGIINLSNLTEGERLLLAPFNNDFYEKREGRLSIKKFIENFTTGIFEGVDFLQVLIAYNGKEIRTNKEKREEVQYNKEIFYEELKETLKNEEVKLWLESVFIYKNYGYQSITRLYKEDKKYLQEILGFIDKSYEKLDYNARNPMPLPKFATIITRDSHYFDIDNIPGKLFLNSLGYLKGKKASSAEKINELLLSVGIVRDEISNFTITFGLRVLDKGEELQGYKWFRREQQPLLLNISNLNSLECIQGVKDKVFAFENPTVFYDLSIRLKDIQVSLVCTSGQPNVSSLMLLDKLTKSGTQVYYSGDFDPEGLSIADNFKYRYGEKLNFFGMTVENYLSCYGDNSFSDRVGKLNTVVSSELKPVIEEMKYKCMAGYQEMLIDYYEKKIRETL